MIEAVTFDFWNTIARVPPGAMTAARRVAVAAACEQGGAEVEAEAVATALERVGLHWERSWAAGDHLHPHEGAALLARELGVEGAAEELVAEAFLGAGRGAELELAPALPEALGALGGAGVRLGIVCDVGFTGGEQLRALLEREGLLARFSGWGFSDEVGHYKPAPQIFEAALAALDAAPARSLHVGDLRRTDVAGAGALGMGTVRYRGLHDDPEPGPEAGAEIDDHGRLPELVAAWGR
jgi:FMN phosphatase YigB (HAD superfamily)